jgi:hypothetical protein
MGGGCLVVVWRVLDDISCSVSVGNRENHGQGWGNAMCLNIRDASMI